MLSNKIVSNEKITLVEGDNIVKTEKETATILNNFFSNIVKKLEIEPYETNDNIFQNISDPVLQAIVRYRDHPSITAINEKCDASSHFTFPKVSEEDILKEISNLKVNKATQGTDIPTKIIKENSDIFGEFILSNINSCIDQSTFPSSLKLANIIPVHKKDSKSLKENYRPVSILSNISKIYERCLYDQIETFFGNILSKYQCGFRKGYNAQHCLIVLIEKWKKSVDNGGAFGALLTDLSKAFDCLSHELLIAKLEAYGFEKKSLVLINDYLTNRKQRVKINDSFSQWGIIDFGVPQGSIMGPLLFNIFICDMFYFLEEYEIANYADDSTPFCAGKNHEVVIETLEQSSTILFKWLKNNYMKVNMDKSHLLLSGNKKLEANIDDNIIVSEQQQELLGISIDSNLSFENHVTNICKKTSQKINALARISPFMDVSQRRVILKSFITSQFGYCPLIWMFHSRTLNNKIIS